MKRVFPTSFPLSMNEKLDVSSGREETIESSLSRENIPLGARILAVARDYIYAIRGVSEVAIVSRTHRCR